MSYARAMVIASPDLPLSIPNASNHSTQKRDSLS